MSIKRPPPSIRTVMSPCGSKRWSEAHPLSS
jgi:hypothetical protein